MKNNKEATIFSADDGEDFFNNLPILKLMLLWHPSGDDLDLGNSVSYCGRNITRTRDTGGELDVVNLTVNHFHFQIVSAMVNNDLLTPCKHHRPPQITGKKLLHSFVHSHQCEDMGSMLCNSLASKINSCLDLMEKTIVLAIWASGHKQFSASLCKLVEKYAEIFSQSGPLNNSTGVLETFGRKKLRLQLLRTPNSKGGSFYGAQHPGFGVADAPHTYYQGAVAQQMNQSVTGSLYSENNQQPIDSSYGRGFGAPSPYQPSPPPPAYQPAPLPQMFVPTPTPQAPETNFAPPPPHAAASQQPTRPFVPANVPMLRNAEQYQQPTLGSQLYPGTANPAYNPVQPPTGSQGPITAQTGAIPGHRMPQAVAPGPAPMGFRPGLLKDLGLVQCNRQVLTQPASLQPAVVPAAPPPTVQTVDTSNVPAHHRPVITTLTRLFKETSEALGGARANPARKREIEDNSRKIGALFAKLNSGDISENASDKLFKLCQALDMNDFSTALQIQVLLTTSEWDECNFWLATLKRMIKTRQGVGVRSS
ncbi:hypothetical protein NC652_002740 [Populus alba x Populus x berolinensis]|nr:hypothetical protein NC652_002740 [Populus alba x Populus x berolinensis]